MESTGSQKREKTVAMQNRSMVTKRRPSTLPVGHLLISFARMFDKSTYAKVSTGLVLIGIGDEINSKYLSGLGAVFFLYGLSHYLVPSQSPGYSPHEDEK
jgi:hypothetical protein